MNNNISKLCNKITYEKIMKNKIIFKQNDESNNKLYFILSGIVGVCTIYNPNEVILTLVLIDTLNNNKLKKRLLRVLKTRSQYQI